ncbi:MAG: lytic murein transglycosylase [Magnetospirillum sp.]|nr:lytic murein transglycosylase [Magnetospirillum sp.]
MKRGTWAIAGIAAAGVVLVAPAWAQDAAAAPDFATFLGGVKVDAAARGIRPETVDAAFADVQPIPKVIEYDRRQPEFTLSFDQYMSRVVSPAKVAKGRKMMAENRALLAEIEKKYGVQARFVAALWGIETDYGRVTGGYPVIASLATLAWDGRRSTYFRGELINALKILDEGHIAPQAMVGSWAGAMGQCQFMPSTFVKWSVDGNGDGRRDVWTNRADALASAANYLAGEGWKGEETWGRAVRLPDGFDVKMIGLDARKSLAEWSRLGVKAANGKPLPKRNLEASIVLAEAGKGPAFLVYDNFRTIMKWNRSTFFALAAGHLADKIGGR